MEVPSPSYTDLIAQMKSQKHIRKGVFVFKDGQFYVNTLELLVLKKLLIFLVIL